MEAKRRKVVVGKRQQRNRIHNIFQNLEESEDTDSDVETSLSLPSSLSKYSPLQVFGLSNNV